MSKVKPRDERLCRDLRNAQRSADEAEMAYAALMYEFQEASYTYRSAIGKVKGPKRGILKKRVRQLRKEAVALKSKIPKAVDRMQSKRARVLSLEEELGEVEKG